MRGLAAAGGAALVLAGLLPWLESPIGARPAAAPALLAALLGSGLVALAALGAWSRAAALDPQRVLAVGGALSSTLAAWALFHLAYADPTLWSLVDENAQYGQIIIFSRTHLTANLGFDPTYDASLTTDSPLGRLSAAFYFMGAGWWLTSACGLAFCAAVLARRQTSAPRWLAAVGAAAAAVAVLSLTPALLAVHREARGDRLLAFGRFAEAIGQYGVAQALTPQAEDNERIWLRKGEAHERLGMATQASSQLYLADRDLRRGQVEAALSRFRLLAGSAPPELRTVVRRRVAWALATSGMNMYSAGKVAAAALRWEESLRVDPTQTQAAFFLSRAYFDQARYDDSIAMCRQVLARARNKILRADAQANIGDAYMRLGQHELARQAYEASRRLDPVANFRILRSLGGT